jgi:hypothetical protein
MHITTGQKELQRGAGYAFLFILVFGGFCTNENMTRSIEACMASQNHAWLRQLKMIKYQWF